MAKPNLQLLKRHKNELFNIITDVGFPPQVFEWDTGDSEYTKYSKVPVIHYPDTPYYFLFDMNNLYFKVRYSPGADYNLHVSAGSLDWEEVLPKFSTWAKAVHEETTTPDYWDFKNIYDVDSIELEKTENTPFSFQEVESIDEAFQNAKTQLPLIEGINTEQVQELSNKLDYLVDSAKRQGRNDWFHTCTGVVFSTAASLALTSEQAHNLWGILKGAIGVVLRSLPI